MGRVSGTMVAGGVLQQVVLYKRLRGRMAYMMVGWFDEIKWRMKCDAPFCNEHSDGALGVIDGLSVYIIVLCPAYTQRCGDLLLQFELPLPSLLYYGVI